MDEYINYEYYYDMPVYGEEDLKYFNGMECRANQLIYGIGDDVVIFTILLDEDHNMRVNRRVCILTDEK